MRGERGHRLVWLGLFVAGLVAWELAAGTSMRAPSLKAALPEAVTVQVVLDMGPGPVKVNKVTTTGWERDLYAGESGEQRVEVSNVTAGYGAASYTVEAAVTPQAPLILATPPGSVVVGPGDEADLAWALAVPVEAGVGPYEEVVELKAEGVPFAVFQVRTGAGEPLVFRGFSYLNGDGNDVGAYIVWPKGTGRFRVSVENQGDAALEVVMDVSAEAGLSCTAEPAGAVLNPGKSLDVVVTCEGAATLDASNDRVTVQIRRGS